MIVILKSISNRFLGNPYYRILKYLTKKRMDWIVPELAQKFDVSSKLIEENPLICEADSVLFDSMVDASDEKDRIREIIPKGYSFNDVFGVTHIENSGNIVCSLPQTIFVHNIGAYGEEGMHYLHALVNPETFDSKQLEVAEFVGYVGSAYAINLSKESKSKEFRKKDIQNSGIFYREEEQNILESVDKIESKTQDDTLKDSNKEFLDIFISAFWKTENYTKHIDNKKELKKIRSDFHKDFDHKRAEEEYNNAKIFMKTFFTFPLYFENLLNDTLSDYHHLIGYYSAITNMDAALNDRALLYRTEDEIFEQYINRDLLKNTYLRMRQLERKKNMFSDCLKNNLSTKPIDIVRSIISSEAAYN